MTPPLMHEELGISTQVDPSGEENFVFTTAGGKVALRTTRDALTPYGGLVSWAAFVRHTGIFERLAASCPVQQWSLLVRLLELSRHVEAAGSRRWFLIIAVRLVQSGRQTAVQLSAKGALSRQLKASYERVARTLVTTAPQFKIIPLPHV